EAFETNNLYDFVRMSTPNTPAALKHERNSMFMRSNFWVVSDYIVPKDITKDNKYEQYWHMLPEANITMEDSTKTVRTNFQDANIQVVPVEYGKYNRSEILEGWYSEGQNNSMKADYVEYERNNKGATSFTTVLFPNDIGKDYAIQTEPINLALDDESANAFTMNVTENNTGISQDYTYYILNERSRKEKVKVNNYSIDGELMMVESNIETKKPVMFTGRNFTEFSDGDKIMVKATKPVEDIGISWSGSTIELSSSVVETKQHVLDYEEDVLASKKNGQSLEKLKNLTIRANGKVDKVLYNGEVIKFKQSGNYVYFGENPIIDDKTPVPTPSAKPDSPSGGSGGGSGNGGGAGGNVVIPPISSVKPSESPEISPKPTQSPAPVVPEDLKKELVGHWAEKEISELIDKGLVNGSDGSLQLETKITRAEFISMLNRATKVEKAGYLGTKSDVALNDWYADDIQTALNAGYLSDESTTVRPNDFITREEMTKIAVIAYESVTGNVITPSDINFTDNEEISDWAVEYVKKSTEAKIINGFEDNTFRPKANTLREQAMVVIYRLLEDLAI
ncbi:MAG: S-layer homology domain-containing protein, partial [Oscillospiraceae bacterium]